MKFCLNTMKPQKNMTPQCAVCINNSAYPASLELHKIYRVLPDDNAKKDGELRISDERDEDYLYPADYFILIEVPKAKERALLQTY